MDTYIYTAWNILVLCRTVDKWMVQMNKTFVKILGKAAQLAKEAIVSWNEFERAMSFVEKHINFENKFSTRQMKKIMNLVESMSKIKCLNNNLHTTIIIPDPIIEDVLILNMHCHECNEFTEIDRINISEIK